MWTEVTSEKKLRLMPRPITSATTPEPNPLLRPAARADGPKSHIRGSNQGPRLPRPALDQVRACTHKRDTSHVLEPEQPECPRCFHNALTCDKRCSSCKIDKHMKKLLQKHGRMTQHQRNRSKNIQRERSRNRARGPPEYTLGSHATAYQSDEGRRGRLGYNKHSKQ